MFKDFTNFNVHNNLFGKHQPVLLAISGGIDSMVLLHLFLESKQKIGIAHCNFQLRGHDADEDEKFVEATAQNFQLPFYSKHFDTVGYSETNKLSIQMAARELRYKWFEEIRNENKYHFIATGHNATDQVETVLLNLVKGTGIKGLHGILPKHDKIIRPILFASKKTIQDYATDQKIKFREDASNITTKYERNHIRHLVLPELSSINGHLEKTMLSNIQHFSEAEILMNEAVTIWKNKCVAFDDDCVKITFRKFEKHAAAETILYELLKEFNFNSSQCHLIAESFSSISGKEFLSATHRLIKDRNHLIITHINTTNPSTIVVNSSTGKFKIKDFEIEFSDHDASRFSISKNKNCCSVDFDKIKFPLTIRSWKKGDYFYPFGMKSKKKKLSNFFTDLKLSIPEKEKQLVVESNKKIVWVVGLRPDERFRIKSSTKRILKMDKI